MYEVNQKVLWTWVRLPPGPPEVILDSDVAERSRDNFKDSLINCIPVLLLMGLPLVFDRVKSNEMDSPAM